MHLKMVSFKNWLIVIWTLKNKLQLKFKQIQAFLFKKMHFKSLSALRWEFCYGIYTITHLGALQGIPAMPSGWGPWQLRVLSCTADRGTSPNCPAHKTGSLSEIDGKFLWKKTKQNNTWPSCLGIILGMSSANERRHYWLSPYLEWSLMPHKYHGITNHWQLSCFPNKMFMLMTKKTKNNKALNCWPFVREIWQWMAGSTHKVPAIRKMCARHNVNINNSCSISHLI